MKNTSIGNLILVPVPLAEGALHTLPAEVFQYTERLQHYFVENARTARRFLRSMHAQLPLEPISLSEMDKHTGPDTKLLERWLAEGKDVGVMSEAGCPVIADPGNLLVAAAHRIGAKVVPLTGPSAILLSLMASGLSGQNFAFNGYLPVKEPARSKRIKELETRAIKEGQAQVFIETPYRNNQILADLLKTCEPHTMLCVAINITAPDSQITTMSISNWKRQAFSLEKAPAMFIIGK